MEGLKNIMEDAVEYQLNKLILHGIFHDIF